MSARRAGPAPAAALCAGVLVLMGAWLAPEGAHAQDTGDGTDIVGLEFTPVGALPPMPLAMPASRNHDYWHVRSQVGLRRGRDGGDLFALAGGVDFQWRGGSVFGVTGGYQWRDCDPGVPDCGGHPFFGAVGRLNFLTGGPTIASVIGDHTATTTLGTELGLGYAPDVAPGLNACTADLGVPISLAMLQRIRVAAYLTPALAMEVDCSGADWSTRFSFITSAGLGVHQVGHPGLDIHVGLQKIFRRGTGYQLGVSVFYVHMP